MLSKGASWSIAHEQAVPWLGGCFEVSAIFYFELSFLIKSVSSFYNIQYIIYEFYFYVVGDRIKIYEILEKKAKND